MRQAGTLAGFAILLGALSARAQFPLTPDQQKWVDKTLSKMSLDEKVGQLLFPFVPAVFMNVQGDAFQTIQRNIDTYHVGGYHIEGGDPLEASLLIRRMQESAKVPLLVTADLEGGAGFQFRGATRFPRAMAMAATGNPQYAFEAANLCAREAKAMGFNVNFYPVVDVNNNPANPIINIRSFGETPQWVSEFATAYIKGTQDAGLIATAKHFPGHGDTSVDSHLDLPAIDFNLARLKAVELPPFEAAIQANVGAVMTAHIFLPQVEKGSGVPASLSAAVTRGLLRKELGFTGLVFTDALPMHAITTHFGAEQAVVMAIEAGADVALEPLDIGKAFEALKASVNRGEISVERLDESVRRLLAAKAWVGLNSARLPDLADADRLVGSPSTQEKAREIIEHAMTLVKDDRHALPLNLPDDEEVLLVNFVDASSPEFTDVTGLTFRAEFEKRHPKTFFASVTPFTSPGEADLLRSLAQHYKTIVVSCAIRIASYKGSVGLTELQLNVLRALSQQGGRFVFALFGSPYLLNYVHELPSYALTFEFFPGAEAAMVRAIFGEIPFQGKLPVTVANFPVGFSLKK